MHYQNINNRKVENLDRSMEEVRKTKKFDHILPLCNHKKHKQRNLQKDASSPSLRKVTSDSLRVTETELLLLQLLRFIKPCFSIVSHMKPIEFLGNSFRRNRSTPSPSLTIHRIVEIVRAKNRKATPL